MTTQSNEEILAQQAKERFEQAVEFYNKKDYQRALQLWEETVDLREQLPLDNLKYRNDLARAYYNCGNTLSDLRRFEEAIEPYQHAIELRKQLPLDNPKYRNDLAGAYNNCGNALAHLGRYREAEEAIEESLKILKELEMEGIYGYREDREMYFGNAMKIFLNESFNFIPELILEHLDPDNEGSAPQSEKMHRDALEGLHKLYLLKVGEYPKLRSEIFQTILKLEQLRAKYFTGTASGAKLSAQFYEENVGDFNKAEQILKQYVEKVPSDPVGYQQVGEFYERRQNKAQALNYFEQSIQIALKQKIEENFIFHSLQNAANLATNKEFPNFMAFNATYAALQRINDIKEWFHSFVDLFEKPEKMILRNHWKIISEDLDNDYQTWLAGYHSNMKEQAEKEFHEKMKQKREAQRRSLHEVIRALDKHLAVIVETLFNSFEQQWDKHDQDWEQADAEQRQAIETEIIQSLQNVIQNLAEKLSEEEKRFAFEELKQDLPLEIWEILKQNEQNILLLAMRMKQQNINQFASLGFGQLIEIALLKRLFYPIKTYVKQQDINIIPHPKHKDDDTVAKFFNGKLNYLMLGSMVGAFNQAVHCDKTVTCKDVENLLLEGLQNFPKHQILLEQPDRTKKIRAEQLQRINKIRNNCAHPEEKMSFEETNEIYDNVIKDTEHAFCRYFMGACH